MIPAPGGSVARARDWAEEEQRKRHDDIERTRQDQGYLVVVRSQDETTEVNKIDLYSFVVMFSRLDC